MIEELLRLSLHVELRRAAGSDDARRTIDGNRARRLLDAGWASETVYAGGRGGVPPVRWLEITPLGRRTLNRYLTAKL